MGASPDLVNVDLNSNPNARFRVFIEDHELLDVIANDLHLCVSLNSPATIVGPGEIDCPGSGALHSDVSYRQGSVKDTGQGLKDDYGVSNVSNFNFIDFNMKELIDEGTLNAADVL
jgi:hypothetical protein